MAPGRPFARGVGTEPRQNSPGGPLDPASARRLGRLLGVDAFLVGTLTEYRAEYFVLESRLVVGAQAARIDAESGKTLWEGTGRRFLFSGLSQGPTGLASAVLEPIRGLRRSNLWKLSDDFVREAGAALRSPAAARAREAAAPVAAARGGALFPVVSVSRRVSLDGNGRHRTGEHRSLPAGAEHPTLLGQ